MTNEEKRELCLSLMRADSEPEVVDILSAAGLWDNKRVWRLYGDRENNFSTIGNQQNRRAGRLARKHSGWREKSRKAKVGSKIGCRHNCRSTR